MNIQNLRNLWILGAESSELKIKEVVHRDSGQRDRRPKAAKKEWSET